MPRLRFRLAHRDRVELHDLSGVDFQLGRSEASDLIVRHSSVASEHARVLSRRGRVIVADLGHAKTGVTKAADRLRAPITLAPGDQVGLGEVLLSAWLGDDRDLPLVGAELDGMKIEGELDSPDAGARRYLLVGESGVAELLAPDARLELSAWRERVVRSGRLLDLDGRPVLLEPLREGFRLSALLDPASRGTIQVPREAGVVLAVEVLRAVHALHRSVGQHGALDPRRVHLDVLGGVALTSPGPIDDFRDPKLFDFLSPERRYGLPPSTAADAYAAGQIAQAALAAAGLEQLGQTELLPLLAEDPRERPYDLAAIAEGLRHAAHALGLDPAAHHLGRAVSVLASPRWPRFSSPSARICSVDDNGPVPGS